MSRAGYFCISRAEVEAIGTDGALLLVWARLLDLAAYGRHRKPWIKGTVEVDVGQAPITEDALAASSDLLTRKIVRRCLADLEARGWIALEPIGRGRRAAGTLVTIPSRAIGKANERANGEQPDRLSPQELAPRPAAQGTTPGTSKGPVLEEEQQDKNNNNTHPPLTAARTHAVDPPASQEGEGERERAGLWEPPAPDELEVLRFAQMRLARIASAPEVERFLLAWRTAPWLTAPRLREAVDWLASHPLARRDTLSIMRVFHIEQARRAVAAWDQQMVEHVAQIFADGSPPPDLVDRLAAQLPSCDREVSRAYFEQLVARLGPAPREALRL